MNVRFFRYGRVGKPSLRRIITFVGCLFSISIAATLAYCALGDNQNVFFTTSSPDGVYSVNLKGDKRRVLLLPHEVRADISKSGKPFLSDIFIHSSHNAFDLSFEAGFPDSRWLSDNILEFYRRQDFEDGADSLTVKNSSNKSVKYLRIQSGNTFLVLDIEPGAKMSLQIPLPRGDSQWLTLAGVFDDNQEIGFRQRSFNRHSDQRSQVNYQILITSSSIQIEDKRNTPLSKYSRQARSGY